MRLLLHSSVFLILAFSNLLANAQNLRGEAFEFYGEEQPLANVLTAIATHSRLGIQVNDTIKDDFSGHLKQRNSLEALNYLSSTFDLVWYSDGSTLFIDPINAMKSSMFQLDTVAARQVKNTMQDLNIWDGRFEWRSLNNKSILMVSGPPKYLELVEKTVNLLNEQVKASSEDALSLKIFKLTHASATDRKVNIRGEEIILPGMASLLRGLLSGGGPSENAIDGSSENALTNRRLNSLSQHESIITNSTRSSDNHLSSDFSNNNRVSHSNVTQRASNTHSYKGAPHPQAAIYPDLGTNAVIVQDYASRIRLYEDLVAQLDIPREQLEISLVIIDMSANSLRDIGVDWSVATHGSSKALLDLVLPGASEAASEKLTQTNADFLATVTALETQGKARVTSSPAVVTENGLEASLDKNETFFVRVQGERVASLEQITYGTLLQVVPRIIPATDKQKSPFISLDVRIEDANRLIDQGVDALPTIRNTQISTRSSVPNGGSLLIGGYYREATTSNRDGIPVLGNIPYLGKFFSHSGDSNSQLVRLFMLSPRILTENAFKNDLAYSEAQPEYPSDIGMFSDLSNYNPEIKRMRFMGECESALSARQRRNSYKNAKIPTRIVQCQENGNLPTYRVITL
ncbi:Outer membrane protein MxiD [Thalassocella blandensis]|nr:Outer membrane protein MxiD [Thalassocella blandensis]